MELYLCYPNTPSWRGAPLKKISTMTTLPFTLSYVKLNFLCVSLDLTTVHSGGCLYLMQVIPI